MATQPPVSLSPVRQACCRTLRVLLHLPSLSCSNWEPFTQALRLLSDFVTAKSCSSSCPRTTQRCYVLLTGRGQSKRETEEAIFQRLSFPSFPPKVRQSHSQLPKRWLGFIQSCWHADSLQSTCMTGLVIERTEKEKSSVQHKYLSNCWE